MFVELSYQVYKDNDNLLKKLMNVTLGKSLSVTGRADYKKPLAGSQSPRSGAPGSLHQTMRLKESIRIQKENERLAMSLVKTEGYYSAKRQADEYKK